jgi:hypothetical protein
LAISKATSKRPLRDSDRAAIGGIEPEVLQVAVEGERQVGGVAKPVAMFQRRRHRLLDILGGHGARQPRHRDFLNVAGVDADHLMRAQRGHDLRGRQRARGAEIRRAIDRDLRGRTRIVDHVADPDEVAGDGDAGPQHGDCERVARALRGGLGCGHDQQSGCEEKRAKGHPWSPQRNNAVVDCII